MKKNSGILMEADENGWGVVLTSDGEFERVRLEGRADCLLGSEVTFSAKDSSLSVSLMRLPRIGYAALVACLLLALLWYSPVVWTAMGRFSSPGPVVAYVSIDINPSIELGVDAAGKVAEATALNDEGRSILEKVAVRGRPVDDVILDITTEASSRGYLAPGSQNMVAISVAPVSSSEPAAEPMLPEPVSKRIVKAEEKVNSKLREFKIDGEVASFIVDPSVREESAAIGISFGKMALLLEAQPDIIEPALGKGSDVRIANIIKSSGTSLENLASKANSEKHWSSLIERFREAEGLRKQGNGKAPQDDQHRAGGRLEPTNTQQNGHGGPQMIEGTITKPKTPDGTKGGDNDNENNMGKITPGRSGAAEQNKKDDREDIGQSRKDDGMNPKPPGARPRDIEEDEDSDKDKDKDNDKDKGEQERSGLLNQTPTQASNGDDRDARPRKEGNNSSRSGHRAIPRTPRR